MVGDTPYDTYYLYTLSGKVQAVVPPALSDATANNGEYNLSSIRKYTYLYRYDHRDRLVEKWIPGSTASVRYIYDKADRPVLTQNANQRVNNQWTLTKYNVHGRPLLTGILTTAESFESLTAGIGSRTITETYNGNQTSGSYGYTQTFSPGAIEVLSVIYYDDYRFLEQDNHFISYTVNALSGDYYRTPKGQITGEIIFTEGDSNRKRFVTHYYNNRGWEVQNNSHDSTGFTDKSYTQYDFVGNRLQMKHTHVGADTSLEELYTYVYDHGNRLIQVKHKLDNSPEVILTSNEYDEVCRLQCTRMNNGTISSEYEYNIRNWLTKINNPLFTQTLHYTDGMGTPYYGGNISSMTWKMNSGAEQGYKFTYDGMSRLKDAIYGEGSTLVSNPNRFNEQITGYDKMGNIIGIKRYGQTSSSGFGLIDDLTLSYNGNQLQSVSDKVSSSVYGNGFEFKDGATKDTEYEYDENGNLTKDLNKKILRIEYNSINLPCRIEFANGHIISNVYDAGGTKLRTVHVMGNESTVTDYCGNVIYEDGRPVKLLTDAGYVTLSDHKYHYFIQDHQGNNRVVVDQNGTVEEVNHYYPFGGLMSGSVGNAVQPYKYNGKELDRKNGLDWYDYGARMYDAALGRWHAVDPMSEKYYSWSPYNYCKNNPVLRIDLDGKDDYIVSETGRLTRLNVPTETDILYTYSGDSKNPKGGNKIEMTEKGLLEEMVKVQKSLNGYKSFGASTNIADASNLFQFVAENTKVEWSLSVFESGGAHTAIIATDRQSNPVQNGIFAKNNLGVIGESKVQIHSHPDSGGTKGGYGNDLRNANPKSKNLVYFQANRTLYEYNNTKSNIKEIPVVEKIGVYEYIENLINKKR